MTWPNGPNQTTDNFSNLASGAARGLGVVTPGTAPQGPYRDIILPVWTITLASAPAAGGTIQTFWLFAESNGVYAGNISPTSTSSQATSLSNVQAYDTLFNNGSLITTLTVNASTTVYYTREFSLYAMFGNVPLNVSVLVFNNTSVAFAAYSSGNQVAQYALDTYT